MDSFLVLHARIPVDRNLDMHSLFGVMVEESRNGVDIVIVVDRERLGMGGCATSCNKPLEIAFLHGSEQRHERQANSCGFFPASEQLLGRQHLPERPASCSIRPVSFRSVGTRCTSSSSMSVLRTWSNTVNALSSLLKARDRPALYMFREFRNGVLLAYRDNSIRGNCSFPPTPPPKSEFRT